MTWVPPGWGPQAGAPSYNLWDSEAGSLFHTLVRPRVGAPAVLPFETHNMAFETDGVNFGPNPENWCHYVRHQFGTQWRVEQKPVLKVALNVETACSGTDAPIKALHMLMGPENIILSRFPGPP